MYKRSWIVLLFAATSALADPAPPLREFLYAMPKGGDLHNHLSGGVYAESFLAWAAQDDLCIDKQNRAIVPCASTDPNIVPASTALTDSNLYSTMLDAMSMRQFRPGAESAHDHFFAVFGKFRAAARRHVPDMVTEVVSRFASENVDYLETTFAADQGGSSAVIAPLLKGSTFREMFDSILGNPENARKLDEVVAGARRILDDAEVTMRDRLRCGARDAKPGCDSTVRYLFELYRGTPRETFFASLLVGYRLASADARVAGVNPVMPEDGYLSMTQFDEQMQMFAFFGRMYPGVHLTAHAGELALGLVPPEGLRYHIRDSVMIAGARRIGHGVDIAYERDASQLLKTMAQRGIAVEICLTSNDIILGVRGREHPLRLYLANNVPVALATDDPGVSRDDMTNQYMRAVEDQGLTYDQLKQIARNSLEYSFAEGESLWDNHDYDDRVDACERESDRCSAFLARNTKARLQWRLEQKFREFESKYGDTLPTPETSAPDR